MELKKLILGLDVKELKGDIILDIKNIKIDSNSVTKGTLFICINGTGFDGHGFIRQVENYGAVAIVTEKILDTPLTQIVVENSRKAMSIISKNFYGGACDKLKIIGVTGTNGKTTTTHIVKYLFDKAGINCGVIGTLGTYYNDVFIEPSLTTPDPIELHKIFSEMLSGGVKVVVMEVSAHALELDKLEGINFEVGIFTNLTQDHLDFFGSMNNYKKAKMKFFESGRCKYIVSNSDDETGLEILNNNEIINGKVKAVSYGIKNPSDVFAINIDGDCTKTEFVLNLFDCIFDIKLNLIGEFNVYNALAGATASALCGIPTDTIASALNEVKTISGRMELVYDKVFTVYVDYAHTPDGLKKALSVLKPLCKGRLICVFGCGGNRDKGKRRIMGKISGELADFTVITSDNPRFEEPMEIISEIEEGIVEVSKKYIIVQERALGIEYALFYAKKDDIVLIAGKGSERYQEILGIKHLFNDKDTIKEILGDKV